MRKMPRILAILSILMVVMFKFQNCAPVPGTGTMAEVDHKVGLIDGWNGVEKLAFMSPTYLVQGDSSRVEVQGTCSTVEGSHAIGWELVRSDDDSVMASGSTQCDLGGFEVELAQVSFADCNSRYEIRAHDVGSANRATTVLRPFCDTSF